MRLAVSTITGPGKTQWSCTVSSSVSADVSSHCNALHCTCLTCADVPCLVTCHISPIQAV